jgi:type I pantothenate kinase
VADEDEPPEIAAYIDFTRKQWSRLRAATPLTLDEDDLATLRGRNDPVALEEVEDVFLPLSRLLNLRFSATRELKVVTETFLGQLHPHAPYVIALAGSVAVGKSTIARILQALLMRWPDHPRVDLVTTDGFLYPNAILEARGIMNRKGFPESYDTRRLLTFLREVKSGESEVRAPIYSHVVYDIVPGEELVTRQPDILILEGLNVLQITPESREFVSDYFDFSIYIDAEEADIEHWYIERFLSLRQTVFVDPRSYFRHFADLGETAAVETAHSIWREINGKNLAENIVPTRERASFIMHKAGDHSVTEVQLRKI